MIVLKQCENVDIRPNITRTNVGAFYFLLKKDKRNFFSSYELVNIAYRYKFNVITVLFHGQKALGFPVWVFTFSKAKESEGRLYELREQETYDINAVKFGFYKDEFFSLLLLPEGRILDLRKLLIKEANGTIATYVGIDKNRNRVVITQYGTNKSIEIEV